MALKIPIPLPIFPSNPPTPNRPSTELRFSRWNNANAEPFVRRRREQQEIEADLRRHRRFQSVTKISDQTPPEPNPSSPSPSPAADFKSNGSPSLPSSPSIPGKASKYSKPPIHPAFRRTSKIRARFSAKPDDNGGVLVGEKGVSYKIKDAPFEFQYSYTETPKVKPLALREPPFLPFGPTTMPRPWTGRAPLPASKKKLPEFDSFKLPPSGKKGVKPVQSPGPFLMGSGPKYGAATREEVLGEPLTAEEVKELVKGCLKTRRQLNMGRDGLTHNMLDNIHALWKRRRVCKIKCKGVCTVDMDNVSQQLEEKTGGKIIYSKGGVLYLFRGRNYNYRTRPRFPLMLWKPVTPVYPRLVQRAPEGLTLEEASEMRKRGRLLPPICKLGKNGVYVNLVKNVKEAFEACELVRINCKDLNRSDCKKIGAKLKDLVPCVLISFEYEHILMWRGKDWQFCLPPLEDKHNEAVEFVSGRTTISSGITDMKGEESLNLHAERSLDELVSARSTESTHLIKMMDIEEVPDISKLKAVADSSTVIHHGASATFGNNSEEVPCPEVPCKRISLNASLSSDENMDLDIYRLETVANPSTVIHQVTSAIAEDNSGEKPCPEIPCRSISLNESLSLEDSMDLDASKLETVADPVTPIHQGTSDSAENNSDEEPCPEILCESTSHNGSLSSEENMDLSLLPFHASPTKADSIICTGELQTILTGSGRCHDKISQGECLSGVMLLLRQAVENGSAMVLDDESSEANVVYEKSVALAKTAPPGPTFRHRIRKAASVKAEKGKSESHEEEMEVEAITIFEKRSNEKKRTKSRREDLTARYSDVVPHGSLGVDELAKLLA